MSVTCAPNCLYIAGNLQNSKWSGFSLILIVLIWIQNAYFGIKVGKARQKYNVQYPNMYAYPGLKQSSEAENLIGDDDATKFNCVQRAHQNHLEQLPCFLALFFGGMFSFPMVTGFATIVWILGRYAYACGYYQSAEKRMWGAFQYIGVLTLIVLNVIFAVYLFTEKNAF